MQAYAQSQNNQDQRFKQLFESNILKQQNHQYISVLIPKHSGQDQSLNHTVTVQVTQGCQQCTHTSSTQNQTTINTEYQQSSSTSSQALTEPIISTTDEKEDQSINSISDNLKITDNITQEEDQQALNEDGENDLIGLDEEASIEIIPSEKDNYNEVFEEEDDKKILVVSDLTNTENSDENVSDNENGEIDNTFESDEEIIDSEILEPTEDEIEQESDSKEDSFDEINIETEVTPIEVEEEINELPKEEINEQPEDEINEQPEDEINEQPEEEISEQPEEEIIEQSEEEISEQPEEESEIDDSTDTKNSDEEVIGDDTEQTEESEENNINLESNSSTEIVSQEEVENSEQKEGDDEKQTIETEEESTQNTNLQKDLTLFQPFNSNLISRIIENIGKTQQKNNLTDNLGHLLVVFQVNNQEQCCEILKEKNIFKESESNQCCSELQNINEIENKELLS